MTGATRAMLAKGCACKVLTMQIAINGQSAQSAGADFSGQHGMFSAMDAASPAIAATAVEVDESAFARAASGANTRPAIKRTANIRQRWIERFTEWFSHDPAHDGKSGSITKARVSLT